MSLRLSRWTVLLVLPLMAGALLLMHGLVAGASEDASHASMSEATSHEHPAPASHEERHCEGCVAGHLMAACVAVVASVATVSFSRRAIRGPRTATPLAETGLLRTARELLRPPDPAWVRLAVMRC